MNSYTISTRNIVKGILGMPRTTRTVQTILKDGAYFSDVPEGMNADCLVQDLNKQAAEEAAFRAQFATEDDYMDFMAEND